METYEDYAENCGQPTAIDVDTAYLDHNDSNNDEVEALRDEVRRLKREVTHLQNLRENAYETIRRLEERLQTQERLSPFGRDLYIYSVRTFLAQQS